MGSFSLAIITVYVYMARRINPNLKPYTRRTAMKNFINRIAHYIDCMLHPFETPIERGARRMMNHIRKNRPDCMPEEVWEKLFARAK